MPLKCHYWQARSSANAAECRDWLSCIHRMPMGCAAAADMREAIAEMLQTLQKTEMQLRMKAVCVFEE